MDMSQKPADAPRKSRLGQPGVKTCRLQTFPTEQLQSSLEVEEKRSVLILVFI